MGVSLTTLANLPIEATRAVRKEESGWTTEREQLLTVLWAQGLSAGQISKQLRGVSRSAVIGKVHRLKLPRRATSTRSHRKGEPVSVSIGSPRPMPKPPVIKPDKHKPKGARPDPDLNVAFVSRDSSQCPMFLEGEELAFGLVCGRPVVDRSFCRDCARLVYVPTPERRAA